MKIKSILSLIRPKEWVKNLFVFIPLFFTPEKLSLNNVLLNCIVFIAFSFIASAVYIFNDINDKELDALHTSKKNRPIASGLISIKTAYFLYFFFIIIGLFLAWYSKSIIIVFIYLIINILYSIKLKHIAIIDISIVSLGFVLRIFAGAIALNIILTHWLVLIVYLLSMMLALGKRKDEINKIEQLEIQTRPSLEGYNNKFIDACLILFLTSTFMAYLLYVSSPEFALKFQNKFLYITSFPVLLGLLKYMQLVFVLNKASSPTKIIWENRIIQGIILIWCLMFVIMIY